MDEVVWAVNPRNDSLESFLTYFNRWAQSYLTRAGLRCRWLVPVDIQELELSAEVRHHLLLASKEAVNNVVKHAAANQVTIRAELTDTKFILVIEDDGRGMDTTRLKNGHGMGNLVSRLKELKGNCTIESLPGQGTRINFELPVPAAFVPSSENP
jgi:signal transduction histidine kinase